MSRFYGSLYVDVVEECGSYFGIELPSYLIYKKKNKIILSRYNGEGNLFCTQVVLLS